MAKGTGLLRYARLTRRQLIVFALTSAALNGVITASVGAWLAHTYSTHESRRQSIESISSLLYERRTRAGMVASAIRRNADIEEIRDRKRAYDNAFVAWNTHVRRNLFVVRDVMGQGKQTKIEQDFEDTLVAAMADVDRCITLAYDKRIAGGDAVAELNACHMSVLHQFVLDCGSSFVNELDKLNRLSFSPLGGGFDEGLQLAQKRIAKGCTRAPAAPSQSPSPATPPPAGPAEATAPSPPASSAPASQANAP